jgi:alkyl hydroperoxide reductase subunit AhpC
MSVESLRIAKQAPEFKATAYVAGSEGPFKEVSLSQFKGKWVCLFFYPLDFTFVCPTEIRGFAKREEEFKALNCQVLGCSTDSEFSHKAWFERDLKDIKFPILADTTRKICSAYNVLLEEKGISFRGTFLIDPQGVLQWMSVNALDVGRSVDEVVRTLAALQTGEKCPVDWHPGDKTL